MKNLKDIDMNALREWTSEIPFWDRKITLIAFQKEGSIIASKSKAGKKAMITNAENTDIFCCAWTGQYSTDIFYVTLKQLRKL